MSRWSDFEAQATDMADGGRKLVYQFGSGSGYLGTVSNDGAPVIQRVDPLIHDGGLYVFLSPGGEASARLAVDPRYAFHTEGPEDTDDEFYITGAVAAAEPAARAALLAAREPDPRVAFPDDEPFELGIDHALLATYRPRAEGNSWPPHYDRWRAPDVKPTANVARPRPYASRDSDWSEFERVAPELAAAVKSQLYFVGIGLGFLGTVRPDGGPRLHPFCPVFSGEGLYGLILDASPKCRDLMRDPRFAIHGFQFPVSPRAVLIRGVATHHEDPALVAQVEDSFKEVGGVSADHALFEFRLHRVCVTEYAGGAPHGAEWAADGAPLGTR